MNSFISLKNLYFPWEGDTIGDVKLWIKGQIFINNIPLRKEKIAPFLSLNNLDYPDQQESLKKKLLALNGHYSLIIETSNFIFCSVDRVRSIPLFYGIKDDSFIISDDANYMRKLIDPPFNEEAGAEFLVTGYVTGNETLFEGIYQIQAGEYLIYNKADGSLIKSYYHRYLHGNYFSDPEEVLLDQLDDVMIRVFQRLIETTKGKQLVVPLSGGLDSRIIVAMLKRLGVDDVICFGYGKRGNHEAEISRQVAEMLGYRWLFVEYTKEKLYSWYNSEQMNKYLDYAGNLTSLPHIQDFFAVKELKEKGVVSGNAVFVPGHSGDMLAGSWIPDESSFNIDNHNQFFDHIMKKHYSLWQWHKTANKIINNIFQKRINSSVNITCINDFDSFVGAIELFNFNERQAKFIVNSVRVYEFFNFEWWIPFWDNELIDFFLKISFEKKLNCLLYYLFASNILFKNSLSFLCHINCTTPFFSSTNFVDNFVFFFDNTHKKLLLKSVLNKRGLFYNFFWQRNIILKEPLSSYIFIDIIYGNKRLLKKINVQQENGLLAFDYLTKKLL